MIPRLLAGYDPTRTFRVDFSRVPSFITPVRRPDRPPPTPRERRTYMFEGTCAVCERTFARKINVDAKEPRTCSIGCAAQIRWAAQGAKAFGRRFGR